MNSYLNNATVSKWAAAFCVVAVFVAFLISYYSARRTAPPAPVDDLSQRWQTVMAEPKDGNLPMLEIRQFAPGELSVLPQPPRPFGLDFGGKMYDNEEYQSDDTYMSPMTDAGLEELTGFPTLAHLNVHLSTVTPIGLKNLAKLPGLKSLRISWTPIGDAGLNEIIACTQLEELDLSETKITDDGLAHLSSLVNLRKLTLNRLEIGEKGIRAVCKLLELRELSMSGLRHPLELRKLVVLKLGYAAENMHLIHNCQNLNQLRFESSDLSDESIKSLQQLKYLRKLWLGHTSERAINTAQKALPQCQVDGFDY